jgi:hypothetical protein
MLTEVLTSGDILAALALTPQVDVAGVRPRHGHLLPRQLAFEASWRTGSIEQKAETDYSSCELTDYQPLS